MFNFEFKLYHTPPTCEKSFIRAKRSINQRIMGHRHEKKVPKHAWSSCSDWLGSRSRLPPAPAFLRAFMSKLNPPVFPAGAGEGAAPPIPV